MRNRLCLVALLASIACSAESEDDADFRVLDIANGDVSIHEGESTSNPDCLIIDIVGGDAYGGPSTGNALLASFTEKGIFSPEGECGCSFDTSGPMLRLRRESDGTAIYTVWNKWVLDGDYSIPPGSGGVSAAAAYTFQTDHVYEGLPTSDNLVATGTANLQFMEGARKLLVAALLDGSCGTGR